MTHEGDPPDGPAPAALDVPDAPQGAAESAGAPVSDLSAASASEPQNVVRVDFKRAQRTAPSDPTAPQKYAVFSRFVQKGKVMVTLDARRPVVSVPRQFVDEQQLNLDFSERFGLADFMYDERGVRASLSFNRQPFFCDVPWSSVYALYSHVDNERLTWARSLPNEILDQLPEASVEHLERVLELQIERLLRNARTERERELKSADAAVDVREDADEAVAAEAALAAAADADADADDDPETVPEVPRVDDGDKPPPPPSRPGLRLVKS